MKKTLIPVLVLSLVISIAILASAFSDTSEDKGVPQQIGFGELIMQNNETESQLVALYFEGTGSGTSVEGRLTTGMPGNETEKSASAPYNLGGEIGLSWLIGNWSTMPLRADMTVDGEAFVKIWARGTGRDVFFSLNFYLNGQDLGQSIVTDTQTVNGDTVFHASDTLNIEMSVTDILEIRLYGGCSIHYTNNWEVVWGNQQYDTHIRINCDPLTLEINDPMISDESVTFTAAIREAFGTPMSALISDIQVFDHSDVSTLEGPLFEEGDNATLMYWIWDYIADGGRSGEYTITLKISYDGENEFTAMGRYSLEFPEGGDEDPGLFGNANWIGYLVIAVAVISTLVVAYKLKERRNANST